jgi:hypothetical protein
MAPKIKKNMLLESVKTDAPEVDQHSGWREAAEENEKSIRHHYSFIFPGRLYKAFMLICRTNGLRMNEVLIDMIERFVEENRESLSDLENL